MHCSMARPVRCAISRRTEDNVTPPAGGPRTIERRIHGSPDRRSKKASRHSRKNASRIGIRNDETSRHCIYPCGAARLSARASGRQRALRGRQEGRLGRLVHLADRQSGGAAAGRGVREKVSGRRGQICPCRFRPERHQGHRRGAGRQGRGRRVRRHRHGAAVAQGRTGRAIHAVGCRQISAGNARSRAAGTRSWFIS